MAKSGSRMALPPSRPLRTGRAPFSASSSSRSQALLDGETRSWRTRTSARLTRSQHVLGTGSRTSAAAPSSALLPEVGLPGVCAASDQTEVCPLSGGGTPPIHVITTRHSLPPSSSTRWHIVRSCDCPTPMGCQRAYHVPCAYQGCRRPQLSAGGAFPASGDGRTPERDHVPFGSGVSARFACLNSPRLDCFTCVDRSIRP